MKYAVFEKNNTGVFLFAKFRSDRHLRGRVLKGASEPHPPPSSIIMEPNSPVQLGLMQVSNIRHAQKQYNSYFHAFFSNDSNRIQQY